MKHYEYILFDLDGTLTESHPGIINAVLYALKKNGIEETDREKLLAFVGPPLTDSFQQYYGMPKEQALRMVDDYREYHQDRGWKENAVYEGIPEVLETLRAQGRKLFVATSKPEPIAIRTVEYFHLDRYIERVFGASMDESRSQKGRVIAYALSEIADISRPEGEDAAQGGQDVPQQRDALRLQDVLMVGDRLHDVEGAKENGLPCVGVLYGYGTRKELEEAGAAAICPEVRDLPGVIAALEE
ncbi:MAG: HAD hydrolase-like protein [Lachnospiraceae bacterium]|nr:HAD hydrolase-like protein [Lachnospiraceae bacterium]